MVHSVSGWTRGVQVKLWDSLRTRVIPECLRGVFTTRRYTNPRLLLPLPLFTITATTTAIAPVVVVVVVVTWAVTVSTLVTSCVNAMVWWTRSSLSSGPRYLALRWTARPLRTVSVWCVIWATRARRSLSRAISHDETLGLPHVMVTTHIYCLYPQGQYWIEYLSSTNNSPSIYGRC